MREILWAAGAAPRTGVIFVTAEIRGNLIIFRESDKPSHYSV